MTETATGTGHQEESPLDRAAALGPLPGIGDEDAAQERGEDGSETADADENAEEIGRGDLPGAIAMH